MGNDGELIESTTALLVLAAKKFSGEKDEDMIMDLKYQLDDVVSNWLAAAYDRREEMEVD